MQSQRINNSPSFQAIQLSAKEGRKVANIIRKYKKEPRPEIKEQLLDVFEPHIKKEAELYDGIIKEDFKQDMYLCLFENLEKVNLKYHPSSNLVNKLNEVKPVDSYATLGLKSIETLTKAEAESLSHEEELLRMHDAKNIVEKSLITTPRLKEILTAGLEGENPREIGKRLFLTSDRVKQLQEKGIRLLNWENRINDAILDKTPIPEQFITNYINYARGIRRAFGKTN